MRATLRTGIAFTAALLVLLAPALAPGAHAEPAACDWYKYTDDDDSGGSSGSIWLDAPGTDDDPYYVQFRANGERLTLYDFKTDGHKAQASVYVTEPDGDYVDDDRFTTGSKETYNLGTPDGSGNIPDGYKVWIRLRHTGTRDWCNARMFTA